MAAQDIVIVHAGLITPVGLTLRETAASARARVARLREIAWRDRRFEPFITGSVPDEGLPELTPKLAALPLQQREARMLRMAHAALEETMTPLQGKTGPVPVLLGLPEQPSSNSSGTQRTRRELVDKKSMGGTAATPRPPLPRR